MGKFSTKMKVLAVLAATALAALAITLVGFSSLTMVGSSLSPVAGGGDTYTFHYDLNGATDAPSVPADERYPEGDTVFLAEISGGERVVGDTRDVFAGWSENKHETAYASRNDAAAVTVITHVMTANEPNSVYVVWVRTHKLVYDTNGGAFESGEEPEVLYYERDDNAYITTAEPVRASAQFVGWSTSRHEPYDDLAAAEAVCDVSDTYKIGDQDAVIYAVYCNTYPVTYDGNGGTYKGGEESTYSEYSLLGGYSLGNPQFSRSGYTFLGWTATRQSELTSWVAPEDRNIVSDVVVPTSGVTVYALWGKNNHLVYAATDPTATVSTLASARWQDFSYLWGTSAPPTYQELTGSFPGDLTLDDYNALGPQDYGSTGRVSVSYGSETQELDGYWKEGSPVRPGYILDGWYDGPQYREVLTNSQKSMGNWPTSLMGNQAAGANMTTSGNTATFTTIGGWEYAFTPVDLKAGVPYRLIATMSLDAAYPLYTTDGEYSYPPFGLEIRQPTNQEPIVDGVNYADRIMVLPAPTDDSTHTLLAGAHTLTTTFTPTVDGTYYLGFAAGAIMDGNNVSFSVTNLSLIENGEVIDGSTITDANPTPAAPQKYEFGQRLDSDVTLYAHWKEAPAGPLFTNLPAQTKTPDIQFDFEDGDYSSNTPSKTESKTVVASDMIEYSFKIKNNSDSGTVHIDEGGLLSSLSLVLDGEPFSGSGTPSASSTFASVRAEKRFLSPGEETTATVKYEVKQSDIDLGYVEWKIRARGTCYNGIKPASHSGTWEESVPADSASCATVRVNFEKTYQFAASTSADIVDGDILYAGESVRLFYEVANTGNTTISNVYFTIPSGDTAPEGTDRHDSPSNAIAEIAPGSTALYETQHVVTQGEIDNGLLAGAAQVHATYISGTSDTKNASFNIELGQITEIVVSAEADPAYLSGAMAGETSSEISYTITNTGNTTFTNLSLASNPAVAMTEQAPSTLAPGTRSVPNTVYAKGTYTIRQHDIDVGQANISITATAKCGNKEGVNASGSGSAVISIERTASIDVSKTIRETQAEIDEMRPGDVLHYVIRVSNTGNANFCRIEISDERIGVDPKASPPTEGSVSTLQIGAGEYYEHAFSYTLTSADFNTGSINNTVSAVAYTSYNPETPDANEPAATAEASCNVILPSNGDIEMTITANPANLLSPTTSTTVEYTATITNTGTVTLYNVEVPFFQFDDESDKVVTTPHQWDSILATESKTVTFSHTVTQGDIDRAAINVAGTVVGFDSAEPGATQRTSTANSTVPVIGDSQMTLVKKVIVNNTELGNGASIGQQTLGSTIRYHYTLTNSGSTTLNDLTFSDASFTGAIIRTFTTQAGGAYMVNRPTFAPGEVLDFYSTYTLVSGDIDRAEVSTTATASAGSPEGSQVDAVAVLVNPIVVSSELMFTPNATPTHIDDAQVGERITYAFVISNTGSTTVTDLVFRADPKMVMDTRPDEIWNTFASGEGQTVWGHYDITQADIDAGNVDVTASIVAKAGASNLNMERTAHTTLGQTLGGSLAADVVGSKPLAVKAGDTVDYKYTLTNTGNSAIVGIRITDDTASSITQPASDFTLAPGSTVDIPGKHAVTQSEIDQGYIQASPVATIKLGNNTSTTVNGDLYAPIKRNGTIKLVARVTPETVENPIPGETTLSYDFDITNTGNTTLSNVTLIDLNRQLRIASLPKTTLAPGEKISTTGMYTIQIEDRQRGSFTSTTYATANTPEKEQTVNSTTTAKTTFTQYTEVALTMTSNEPPNMGVKKAGDIISYSYAVRNTGTAAITSFELGNTLEGVDYDMSTVALPLLAGTTANITAIYALTQEDVDRGYVSSVGSVSASSDQESDVTASSGPVRNNITRSGAIEVDVVPAVDSLDGPKAGDVVTFNYTLSNIGNTVLDTLGISEMRLSPIELSTGDLPETLAPGAVATITGTYTLTQADVDAGKVVASASASARTPESLSPLSAASPEAQMNLNEAPSMTLEKTIVEQQPIQARAGDTIHFNFKVTNTGNTAITSIVLEESNSSVEIDDDAMSAATLAPDESVEAMGTYELTQDDIDAGQIANAASVIARSSLGEVVEAEDSVQGQLSISGAISLTKMAVQTSITAPKVGDVIDYNFTVTNEGNGTLSNIVIVDDLPSTTLSGGGAVTDVLAPGQSANATGQHVLTQEDLNAGLVVNTARVYAKTTNGLSVESQDAQATTDLVQSGALRLVKTTTSTFDNLRAGDTLRYNYLIENTGNTVLTEINLADDQGTVIDASGIPASLAPNGRCTATGTYVVSQDEIDTGSVGGTAHVRANSPAEPAVSTQSTLVNSIIHRNSVAIEKLSDVERVEEPVVGKTINYTLTVKNTGNTTLHELTVADALEGMTLNTSGMQTTLAPGASTTLTGSYPITQQDIVSGKVVNTATASAKSPANANVSNSATRLVYVDPIPAIQLVKSIAGGTDTLTLNAGDKINYNFTITNTGTSAVRNITLVDDNSAVVISQTMMSTTLMPGSSTMATGTYTVTQEDIDAGSFFNSAAVSASTDQVPVSDTSSVTAILRPSKSLTLTMLPRESSIASPVAGTSKVVYDYTIANTGNVALDGTELTNTLGGIVLDPASLPASIAPNATATAVGTYTVSQSDIDRGSVSNTATATSAPASDTAWATVNLTRTKGISFSMAVDADTSNMTAGDKIPYTFTLVNEGNTTAKAPSLANSIPVVLDEAMPSFIAPGQTLTLTGDYTITRSDAENGAVTNDATFTATAYDTTTMTQSASKISPIRQGTPPDPGGDEHPAVTLSIIDVDSVPSTIKAGDPLGFKVRVANTGDSALSNIRLGGATVAGTVPASLAPSASADVAMTMAVSQSAINNGTIPIEVGVTATSAKGTGVSDTASASANVPRSISISGPSDVLVDSVISLRATTNGGAVRWSSSNNATATVSDGGVVSGKKVGVVTITAALVSDPSVNATKQVTVKASPVVHAPSQLPVGGSAKISAPGYTPKIVEGTGKATLNGNTLTASKTGTVVIGLFDENNQQVSTCSIKVYAFSGAYMIASTIDEDYVLDISAASTVNGANLQLYKRNNTNAQKFYFVRMSDGYYKIRNAKSGKVFDVKDGSVKNSANIQQWGSVTGDHQRWSIRVDDAGRMTFINKKSGKALDLWDGKCVNGRNIHQYTDNGKPSQKWVVKSTSVNMGALYEGTYKIAAASNADYVLDVSGGSFAEGANIQLWKNNNTKAQRWNVEYVGNGLYKITNIGSGKAVDVEAAAWRSGANVRQWTWNATTAQLWKPVKNPDGTYTFYRNGDTRWALDIAGNKMADGANIRQASASSGAKSQRFKLTQF